MALRGTDPESYITEYTLVYEDNPAPGSRRGGYFGGVIDGGGVHLAVHPDGAVHHLSP